MEEEKKCEEGTLLKKRGGFVVYGASGRYVDVGSRKMLEESLPRCQKRSSNRLRLLQKESLMLPREDLPISPVLLNKVPIEAKELEGEFGVDTSDSKDC